MSARTRYLATLLLVAFAPGVSSAEPKSTTFENVMKKSSTIVVARYPAERPGAGKPITLDVLRVLRGEAKPGELKVEYKDFPWKMTGEFVAFLDGNVWRYVAVPVGSKKVEGAPLALHGFNDNNAHYITPGLITEEMLKTYMKDGTLTYRFRAPIHFPQPGKPDWKASGPVLAVSYDAVADKTTIKAAPHWKGFPTRAEVRLSGRDGGTTLYFWEELRRPFELRGTVTGLDKQSGELLFRFVVAQPQVLTEKALGEYLADPETGGTIATFKLTCTPGAGQRCPKTLSLVLGRNWGSSFPQLDGWEKEPLKVVAEGYHGPELNYGSMSYCSGSGALPEVIEKELKKEDGFFRLAARTGEGGYVLVALALNQIQTDAQVPQEIRTDLLYLLYSGEFKGSVFVFEGKEVKLVAALSCTYESSTFNRPKK
jgi:hypothetical protein